MVATCVRTCIGYLVTWHRVCGTNTIHQSDCWKLRAKLLAGFIVSSLAILVCQWPRHNSQSAMKSCVSKLIGACNGNEAAHIQCGW